MENISQEEFLSLLNTALKDKNLSNLEFRILTYIYNNSDFMVSDLKKDLKISSFNIISKSIKNLIKLDYIVKETKHIKHQKNISSFNYSVISKNLLLQKNDNDTIFSPFKQENEIFNYFFEKISTNRKIDKFAEIHQITLLLEMDKFKPSYIFTLIDFISNDTECKKLYNRPHLMRKNIKTIIQLSEKKASL